MSIPDKAIMYASVFSTLPIKARHDWLAYQFPSNVIVTFQNEGKLPEDSLMQLQKLQAANETEQRANILDKPV